MNGTVRSQINGTGPSQIGGTPQNEHCTAASHSSEGQHLKQPLGLALAPNDDSHDNDRRAFGERKLTLGCRRSGRSAEVHQHIADRQGGQGGDQVHQQSPLMHNMTGSPMSDAHSALPKL